MSTAENGQSSWLGLGWDYSPGFIERKYIGCADLATKASTPAIAVLGSNTCWESDNATISLNGHSTELERVGLTSDGMASYVLRDDPGWSVQRRVSTGNGAFGGEYWLVIDPKGVQYWFGVSQETGSGLGSGGRTPNAFNATLLEPVYGARAGDPCHGATLAASVCNQAYRWNLVKRVDPHSNVQEYFWTKEAGYYQDAYSATKRPYDRAGYLNRIEYGRNLANMAPVLPPQQVTFTVSGRCITITACPVMDSGHATSYPDVPMDQYCTVSGTCTANAPVFFTQFRLAQITTQTLVAAAMSTVDQYTFGHSWPDPGDTSDPGLFLDSITHADPAGNVMPAVVFGRKALVNRPYFSGSNLPFKKFRVISITNEMGGQTLVGYSQPDPCPSAGSPASNSNTYDCYPQWTSDPVSPGFTWFNKWLATQIVQVERYSAPSIITNYTYSGNAAWAHDDSLVALPAHLTWNMWRGYPEVDTTVGTSGTWSLTKSVYYQGMNGDYVSPGVTRSVTLASLQPDPSTRTDSLWLAGRLRQQVTWNSAGTKYGTEDLIDYTIHGPLGITAHDAYQVMEGVSFHRVGNAANTASSWSQTATTYHPVYALAASVSTTSSGNTVTDPTDTCVSYAYAVNNAPLAWMIDFPTVAVTQAGPCPASGAVLVRTDTYYDQMTSTATAATQGDPMRVDSYDTYGPPTHFVSSMATFDTLGRVTSTTDAHHNVTTTAYTPATTGPVTSMTVTNPVGQTSTTTLDAYRSQPLTVAVTGATGPTRTTTATYDGFGRLIKVWQPGVPTAGTPSVAYAYTVSNAAAPNVQTDLRQDATTVVSSWAYLDSFGRPRDTQAPSPTSTGRVVTMVTYDDQGRPSVTTAPFTQTNAPGSGAATVNLATVPMETTAGYDSFGRQVSATTSESNGTAQVTRWATTTAFDGLATTIHPPPAVAAPAPLTGTQPTYGDTVTTTDPLGRVLSVAEHTGTVGVGGDTVSATTSRQYDGAGRLTALLAGGNTTTYGYDLLGRRTSSVDPDAGTSSTAYADTAFTWATYSAAAANANLYNTTTSTDANAVQVRSTTDVLGRTTEVDSSPIGSTWSRLSTSLFDDSADGTGHWPGQLTRSTAYVGATSLTTGTPYVTDLTYDNRMRPTGKTVTIPTAAGTQLAGTYTFASTFDDASHQTSVTYPAAGGLAAETVTTAFDAEGFIGAVTTSLAGAPSPLAAAPAFDAVGRVAGRTLGTGAGKVVTGYSFTGTAQRLSEVTAAVGTTTPAVVRDDTYLFDSSGNPLSVRDTVAGQSQCNSYDTRNRLTSAFTSAAVTCAAGTADSAGPDPFKETYGYNAANNNITSITRGLTTPVTTTEAYAAPGHAHAVSATSGGAVSGFTYNADGTMATRTGVGAGTYTWDAQGRMASVTPQGAGTSTMVYNADGSRLLRKDPAATTLYLDGTELKLTGTTVTGTRYYTQAGTTIGMRTAAGLTWVLGDTQGSFSLTVNATNGAVNRQRYLPYGGLRNTTPLLGTDRGWLGKTVDTTSGLDYLGARYYDPGLAHFTSPDPLLNPADPTSYSAYAYAGDNPAGYADPTGLRTEDTYYGPKSETRLWDWLPVDQDAKEHPVASIGITGNIDQDVNNSLAAAFTQKNLAETRNAATNPNYSAYSRAINSQIYNYLLQEIIDGKVITPYGNGTFQAMDLREQFPSAAMFFALGMAGVKGAVPGGYSGGKSGSAPAETGEDRAPLFTGPGPGGGESTAAAYGRRVHSTYDYGPGFEPEFALENGQRADAVNLASREVVELKPNNPRAIRLGQRQAQGYADQLTQEFPGTPFIPRVVTYDRP